MITSLNHFYFIKPWVINAQASSKLAIRKKKKSILQLRIRSTNIRMIETEIVICGDYEYIYKGYI